MHARQRTRGEMLDYINAHREASGYLPRKFKKSMTRLNLQAEIDRIEQAAQFGEDPFSHEPVEHIIKQFRKRFRTTVTVEYDEEDESMHVFVGSTQREYVMYVGSDDTEYDFELQGRHPRHVVHRVTFPIE